MATRLQLVRIIKSELEANPVFAASLGSHELFHSNIIAWIFSKYPQAVRLIPNIDFRGVPEIRREKDNIDLMLRFEDGTIAIENKMKSIVRKSQIERYSEKLSNQKKFKHPVRKFLLTYADTDFLEHDGWSVISYREIESGLRELAQEILDENDRMFIQKYCCMLSGLGDLKNCIDEIYVDRKKYWFLIADVNEHNSIDKILNELRFRDTFLKIDASSLENELRQSIDDRNKPTTGELLSIQIKSDMTNKTPLVEAWLNSHNKKLKIGVQIQGDQYRRFVNWEDAAFKFPKKNETQGERECRDQISELGKVLKGAEDWFFANSERDFRLSAKNGYFHQKGFFVSGHGRNQYGIFAPHFLHRYIYVENYASERDHKELMLKPDKICEAVIADLTFASKLLKCCPL